MSRSTRLIALAQAIGADIKDLKTKTPLSVISAQPVLDVGMVNQIRAGRQLTAVDFTNMGLSAPLGLWNFSNNAVDSSGNGRTLSLKNGGPGYVEGINGAALTASSFDGSGNILYLSDIGAGDPFRIRTGSWGCWFKASKRGVLQNVFSKAAAAPQNGWWLGIGSGNSLFAQISSTGSDYNGAFGITDVCDDRWHFAVGTFDGNCLKIYVDAVCEGMFVQAGAMFASSGPLNVGGQYGDAATAAGSPLFGRVDEAFVTGDVLSENQIYNLYCVKIPHTLTVVPTRVICNVRRRRRGATFVAADFPAQPVRLYNFSAGSLNDEGTNNVVLVTTGAAGIIVPIAGADGIANNAQSFNTLAHLGIGNTDTGLPAAFSSRSYGCWFKTIATASQSVLAWGTSGADARISLAGAIFGASGSDTITGPFAADGSWHFAVVVENNAATDGVKRKLYLDGRLVGISATVVSLVLGGIDHFRIGANVGGAQPFVGQIDGVFVTTILLSSEDISKLYAKGSQTLALSPKNSGDHVEAMTATDLLATFDTLDSTYQVDLGVAA